jgi:plasmid maintenance system antidote protein VapI
LFTFLVIYRFGKLNEDGAMTREEIRRENARRLATDNGGLAEFGRILGMEPSQVSQLIGKNPHKNIGNSIAKRVEQAYGKPEGWLDIVHSQENGKNERQTPWLAVDNADANAILRKLHAARELGILNEREVELLARYRMATSDGQDYISTMADAAEVDESFIAHHKFQS